MEFVVGVNAAVLSNCKEPKRRDSFPHTAAGYANTILEIFLDSPTLSLDNTRFVYYRTLCFAARMAKG